MAVKMFMGSPAMFMGHSGIWRQNGDSSVMSAWLRHDCLLFACPQRPKARSGARTGFGIVAATENGGARYRGADQRDLTVLRQTAYPRGWPLVSEGKRAPSLRQSSILIWVVLLCKHSMQPRLACCCLKERCLGDLQMYLRQQARKRL